MMSTKNYSHGALYTLPANIPNELQTTTSIYKSVQSQQQLNEQQQTITSLQTQIDSLTTRTNNLENMLNGVTAYMIEYGRRTEILRRALIYFHYGAPGVQATITKYPWSSGYWNAAWLYP